MQKFLSLSKKVLLYPYYASFIFFFIAAFDTAFLHGDLKKILPTNIADLFIYYAIFEFPHIIASFFMLGEKDYFQAFKKILLKNLYLLVGFGLIVIIFSPSLFYILYIAYTLYHVVKQQFGIAKMYELHPSKYLSLLQWIFIGTGIVALINLALSLPKVWIEGSMYVALISILIYFIHETKNRSNLYLTLYILSFGAASILYGNGYILFGLLSMRIVHDITAFIFYSTHNYNRKKDGSNFIYSSPLTKNLSPLILTPLLAILLNLLYLYAMHLAVDTHVIKAILLSIYFGLSMAHYNIEGVVWKRGSIARTYINVS